MQIQAYDSKFQAQLISLWNRCLPRDGINEPILFNKILSDDNFDPQTALCAVEGDELVGFVLAMKRRVPYLYRGLEEDKGWISIIFVAPEKRRQGIGRALTEQACELLRHKGAKTVVLGAYSPNYFVPGIDAESGAQTFFEKMGFELIDSHYSMYRVLFDYEMSPYVQQKQAELEAKGYRFSMYSDEYAEKLSAFLENGFSAGWMYNVKLLIDAGVASQQIYLYLDPDDQVVGYCMRGMQGNQNRFGPFGVREDMRNMAIGSVLFANALLEMRRQNVYFIYFMTTDEPGKRFYLRHGLQVARTFIASKKEL